MIAIYVLVGALLIVSGIGAGWIIFAGSWCCDECHPPVDADLDNATLVCTGCKRGSNCKGNKVNVDSRGITIFREDDGTLVVY